MEAADRFEKDGFVVLERVFDPAFIDALRAEYVRQFPNIARDATAYVVGDRRLQVAVQLTGPFLSPDLYANPTVLALTKAALGDDILIDNFSLVSALPGAAAQHAHADHPDLFPEHIFSRAVIRPYALNVAIPLIDLTPETGTTKLFTGSQNRHWSEDLFILPYIARGGCYLADYRLRHFGTENRTSAERPIVYLTFARPWFTDAVNYEGNVRINMAIDDLPAIPAEHRPLFRRLAAKGAFDRTAKELLEFPVK